LQDFNAQVDKIRQRGDRLQARVDQLLKSNSP
jgi:ubiquinone biosynthesis protein UbiJ